jgi:restriction system protein
MGRRRRSKNKGLAEELIEQPWQVSAVLAVASFIGIGWIAPAFFSGPVLAGLRPLLGSFSWLAFAGFSFIAFLAFVRPKLQDGFRSPKARQEPAAPRVNLPLSKPASPLDPTIPLPPLREQNAPEALPAEWSIEALQMLEWKRFELLCARYYQEVGFRTETLACGPDGGIDVKLFRADRSEPLAIVQCKAWNKWAVGVKEIRELLGVMTHEKVSRGIFIASGGYSKDASAFGAANPIQLLDGKGLVQKIKELTPEKQKALLEFAFAGDYRTPTCPSCGVKLVTREGKKGTFWGCVYYPRCRFRLPQ